LRYAQFESFSFLKVGPLHCNNTKRKERKFSKERSTIKMIYLLDIGLVTISVYSIDVMGIIAVIEALLHLSIAKAVLLLNKMLKHGNKRRS
jgi:hypothetical protein